MKLAIVAIVSLSCVYAFPAHATDCGPDYRGDGTACLPATDNTKDLLDYIRGWCAQDESRPETSGVWKGSWQACYRGFIKNSQAPVAVKRQLAEALAKDAKEKRRPEWKALDRDDKKICDNPNRPYVCERWLYPCEANVAEDRPSYCKRKSSQ